MAKKQPYSVVTFHTTAQALGFKAFAGSRDLSGRLAPIPRQLSAGCGFAWLEPGGALAEARRSLDAVLVDYELGYEAVAELEL